MVRLTNLKHITEKSGTPDANANLLTPKDPFDWQAIRPFQADQIDHQDPKFKDTAFSFDDDSAFNSEMKFNDLAASPFSGFDSPFDNVRIDGWMDKYAFSNFVNPDDKISNMTVPKIAFDEPVVEEIEEEIVNTATEPATEKSAVKMDDVAGKTPSSGVDV